MAAGDAETAARGPPAAAGQPGGALAELALLKLAVPDERANLHPSVRDLQLSELAQLVDVHDHLGAGPAEMQVDQQALAASQNGRMSAEFGQKFGCLGHRGYGAVAERRRLHRMKAEWRGIPITRGIPHR